MEPPSETLRRIGSGTHGIVYRSSRPGAEDRAVKIIDVGKDGIWTLEPTIMNTIVSPFLVQAEKITYFPPGEGHDRLAPQGEIQIEMRLANCDLGSWLEKNTPTTDQAIVWAHDMLQAVWALHSNNIIHADIKPANILVYPDGLIRLADFSSACWLASKHTRAKLYTPTNRPPEVWAGNPVTPASDLWALGCTLLEMVAKLPPVRRAKYDSDYLNDMRNLIQALGHRSERPPEYQSGHAPEVRSRAISSPLYDLIRRLLNPTPEQRGTIPELLQTFFSATPIPADLRLPEVLPLNEAQLLELETITEGASEEVRDLTRQMLEMYGLQRILVREVFLVAYCVALKFTLGEVIVIPHYYVLEMELLETINFCIG